MDPWPGIESGPPALRALSLTHTESYFLPWTTRGVPNSGLFKMTNTTCPWVCGNESVDCQKDSERAHCVSVITWKHGEKWWTASTICLHGVISGNRLMEKQAMGEGSQNNTSGSPIPVAHWFKASGNWLVLLGNSSGEKSLPMSSCEGWSPLFVGHIPEPAG